MKKLLFFSLAAVSLSAVSQVNLQNGLTACYPLDCPNNGLAANFAATGSALDGSINGNVTCAPGRLNVPNTAFQFGGTPSDYVALPNNLLIKPTTSLTVSGWYYLTNLAHQDIIFTKNTCSSNFNAYNLIFDNGFFEIVKKPSSCSGGISAYSNSYNINSWHHVVFYLDDTKSTIIVDNNAPITVFHNVIFDYDPNKGVVLGGTNEFAANYPYSGSIDNLRFYNRELTAAEITALYADPSCGSAPTASFTSQKQTCMGQTLYFMNQSGNSPVTYNWQFPGGNPAQSTATNPAVSYPIAGTYTVTLIATNSAGSSAPYTQTVSVSECIGLSEFQSAEAPVVFPNPTTGKIFIANAGHLVEIFDMTGRRMKFSAKKNHEDQLEIDLHEQPGIYFLRLVNEGSNTIFNAKIILTD